MQRRSILIAKRTAQQGAVLIVSLIILLVMTVVGVSSMMSTTLQERMAGNSKQRTLAKYSAESALKAGEEFLRNNVKGVQHLAKFNGEGGLYTEVVDAPRGLRPMAAITFDVTEDESWTAGNSRLMDDITYNDSAVPLSKQPRYVIEYLGREVSGSNIVNIIGDNVQTPSSEPHIFRIVAIGWAQDTEFYSVMQSTYRTGSSEEFGYF